MENTVLFDQNSRTVFMYERNALIIKLISSDLLSESPDYCCDKIQQKLDTAMALKVNQ